MYIFYIAYYTIIDIKNKMFFIYKPFPRTHKRFLLHYGIWGEKGFRCILMYL